MTEQDLRNRFATRLKILRTINNITQDDLAQQLNVSKRMVAYYETGKATPSLKVMCKLGEVFNTDPGIFFANEATIRI